MAEMSTLARPYAEALFKLALESNQIDRWSELLNWLAALVQDAQMQQLISNPKLDREQSLNLMGELLGERLDQQGRRFLGLLVENHRLAALPEMRTQFEAKLHAYRGQIDARIDSAYELNDAEVTSLVQRLETHFHCKINPEVHVDGALIGGIRVTVGDVVIDSSVRARLAQMAVALKR